MHFYRPTWAEINLRHLADNFYQVKKLLLPKTKIMVTVKADAYGHGMIPVAKKLIGCGVDFLGVASIDEGIKLREQKIKIPVLVLGTILERDALPLFEYHLTPTVCTYALASALNRRAQALGRPLKIHLKVDTGMGRFGVLTKDALELTQSIRELKFIPIEGIFTHFPLADTDREFTLLQIRMFNHLVDKLQRYGLRIPLVHAANSLGVLDFKESHFNLVRPGLVIYGLYPRENLKIKLKPVLSLKTKVVYFKRLPKNYGISYGHIYLTKRETTVATLPVGYGDGYPRHLSNRGLVLIRGQRFRISGRVCMDQIMVDVGNLRLRLGEEAVLIGGQGKNKITAEELAELSDTIPYEIVCSLGSRIPRIYTE